MEKLTKSSPLKQIVDTINELIDIHNKNNPLLDSLRGVPEAVNKDYRPSEIQKKVITVEATGSYIFSYEGKGAVQIYVNGEKNVSKIRYELTPENPREDNIILCNGDKIYFVLSDVEKDETIHMELEKNMIQYIHDMNREIERLKRG